MAIASFKSGLKANLPSTLVNGGIYITTDTGELFFGSENSGVKISDFVAVASYEELPAAPLSNKFYYVTGEAVIYKYQNGQWTPIGGGGGGSVNAGVGLAKSGSTIKAKLLSESNLTNDAVNVTEVSGRVYAVVPDKTGKLAVNVPWTDTTYENKAAASEGTDVSLVTTGDKYNWNSKTSNTGTVTSVSGATGLTGTVTTTGTIKANLVSETALTNAATAAAEVADRVYPVALDANGKLAVNVPWVQGSSTTGTVTSVATGAGLTGGTITNSGTLKANLRSETKLTNDSAAATETSGRVYPVALDKSGYLAVNVPWSNTEYENKAAASGGTAVSLVTTGDKYNWNNKSNLAIGTTATTAAAGNHTHTATIAADTGTSQLSMAANTKYKLTAGGSTYIFTTPKDTTYESKSAASGGTAVSLVTTGEKYNWNNKSNLAIGTTATTAAAGNHTHTATIAADNGTNQLTMSASTKYKLTAGGSSYIFTTPPNTTYESKAAASGGTAVSLVTTGEKYTWNNKSSLAIGTTATTAAAGNHTHTTTIATDSGTNQLTMAASTKYKLTAGGSTYIFTTPPNTTYSAGTGISISGTTINCTVAGATWTQTKSGAVGATSVSITNPKNSTSISVDPYCENSGGANGGTAPVGITEINVTASTITLRFSALTVATTFKCLVY